MLPLTSTQQNREKAIKNRKYFIGGIAASDEDPMAGLANLFDLGVVFMVGLFVALMSAYSIMDFVSAKTEITVIKKTDNGEMQIITKKGKELKVERISNQKSGGLLGTKLGTAYQLKDGRTIYVPE